MYFTQIGFWSGLGFSAGQHSDQLAPYIMEDRSDRHAFHWLEKMPSQLKKYSNSYILLLTEAGKKLHYVNEYQQVEEVIIADQARFDRDYQTLVNSTNIPVVVLDGLQISGMITSNGGHKPPVPEGKTQQQQQSLGYLGFIMLLKTFGFMAVGYGLDYMSESVMGLNM